MAADSELPPATPAASEAGVPPAGPPRSLLDDAEDLLVDVRTWAEAELAYQRTRARFVGHSAKRAIALGIAGALFALFALGGLTVGLIIALTPHLTAWGATAVVVVALLVLAFLAVNAAGKAWREGMDAINETDGSA